MKLFLILFLIILTTLSWSKELSDPPDHSEMAHFKGHLGIIEKGNSYYAYPGDSIVSTRIIEELASKIKDKADESKHYELRVYGSSSFKRTIHPTGNKGLAKDRAEAVILNLKKHLKGKNFFFSMSGFGVNGEKKYKDLIKFYEHQYVRVDLILQDTDCGNKIHPDSPKGGQGFVTKKIKVPGVKEIYIDLESRFIPDEFKIGDQSFTLSDDELMHQESFHDLSLKTINNAIKYCEKVVKIHNCKDFVINQIALSPSAITLKVIKQKLLSRGVSLKQALSWTEDVKSKLGALVAVNASYRLNPGCFKAWQGITDKNIVNRYIDPAKYVKDGILEVQVNAPCNTTFWEIRVRCKY